MPIDPNAVGKTEGPSERRWTARDVNLYALGVGAGQLDPTGDELDFTTDNTSGLEPKVLPTYAVVIGGAFIRDIGTYKPGALVHGEQRIELHRPIPVKGTAQTTATVAAIYDKGKGALVEFEGTSVDPDTGEKLWTTRSGMYIRGEGGFGGDRGESGPKNVAPERDPDHVVKYPTRTDQALLYRLSGDKNPLHTDPAFAERAGFPKPILHGLCTYGFTGRALLHELCGSDPARFKSMEGRFSKPVFPGDTLVVKMWLDGEDSAVFRTEREDGTIVLDNGRLVFT